MVRTLTNAFATGRIAQAYMLTGVRGVGKTTTARILARALNYQTDEIDAPTIDMPKLGVHCAAIMESRHLDVIEMDAASNTGIDDIREIIESVRYAPVSARTKVYIIDEVHMLSKAAFNGLLKTLEEPPPHVKFIFATTEIQKVPVTVLSRCQRFDLRRVPLETLAAHFKKIAKLEQVSIEEEALLLIARAAEGSVRDGLSILDQAIAHGGGEITAAAIRDMLGLADRTRVVELLQSVLAGKAEAALKTLDELHRDGADAEQLLGELARCAHLLTRMKVAGPDSAGPELSEAIRQQLLALGEGLSIPVLSRLWQMLLKGLEEVKTAPDRQAAAEMVIIRLAHIANLPAPDELIKQFQHAPLQPAPSSGNRTDTATPRPDMVMERMRERMREHMAETPAAVRQPAPPPPPVKLNRFEDLIDCALAKRDLMLKVDLENHVRLVRFEPNKLVIRPLPQASKTLIQDLSQKLKEWTGERWMVALSEEEGAPPVGEQRRAAQQARIQAARSHPMVKTALELFPDAEITDVRKIDAPPSQASSEFKSKA